MFFVHEMKELFASRDKLIKVEHIGCFSKVVATLLWPSVGVKPNTWKK
jgi:hypothetical protein